MRSKNNNKKTLTKIATELFVHYYDNLSSIHQEDTRTSTAYKLAIEHAEITIKLLQRTINSCPTATPQDSINEHAAVIVILKHQSE